MSKPDFSADTKSLFEVEEKVLKFWEDQNIFQKSLDKNPRENIFSFYDGPPFITGIPHYATLLPSIAKDIIPRYQTMKGKYVRRIWGWDTHGLPAENQVEKQLGLKVKKDIEALGVDKFIAACRSYVGEVSDAWKWYIDHIGRWADMENAYRTDSLEYMESVIWVFKQLYDKGLIYRGRRTSLYCPRCATALSKFEVTMDDDSYRDVEDPAVTIAFRLLGDEVYLLAWTTTPWTLPANLGLAVDAKAEYVKVTDGKKQYILAHEALPRYADRDFKILETFKGQQLVGQKFEPLYSFLPTNPETDFQVYSADFVAMDEGTGIVHIAPGFGEEDTKLGEKVGLSLHETVDDAGHFVAEVKPWAGMYYKKANPLISAELLARGLLFKEEVITHSYPHCYRCSTPLIYKAQVSWYMSIEPLRAELLKTNKDINWVPKHFGDKRFAHNVTNAPDWSISRTRYWGTPLPVWETEDGEIFVPGSINELEKLSGQKINDLHRPKIDEVVLTLPNGKNAHRIKEVLDVWFESGSMPYGQDHYPFENEKVFEQHFPTDFIIEYTGQLRGWFYYLHVLANALKGGIAFKNVAVTGVLMGNDGRKMSKSYGNYPDPRGTIEKFGAESLRLYFMGSKIMAGEDLAISEDDIREQSRLLNVFHNSLKYYLTYAGVANFSGNNSEGEVSAVEPTVLDRWIVVRLEEAIKEYSEALDKYDFQSSTKAIRPLIEDLSTWYIRRSRDRFVAGDQAALATLGQVLLRSAIAFAPTIPFTSEYFYQQLGGKLESIHLEDYPIVDEKALKQEKETIEVMRTVREVASIAHMQRAEAKLPLRQPLSCLTVGGAQDLAQREDLIEVLRDELNVESVEFGQETRIDTKLTPELQIEGRYRDLARKLQEARKQAGLKVGELASFHYFTRDDELRDLIEKHSSELAKTVSLRSIEPIADSATLTKLDGEELAYRFE
ncbi:MAG: isoleucine--tRNA ligase [bacterium]|nr:isoleucine--tRNA ligase [bacterium]